MARKAAVARDSARRKKPWSGGSGSGPKLIIHLTVSHGRTGWLARSGTGSRPRDRRRPAQGRGRERPPVSDAPRRSRTGDSCQGPARQGGFSGAVAVGRELAEVGGVGTLAERLGQAPDLRFPDPAVPPRDFLEAGDFESLAFFDGLDERAGFNQAPGRARVEPGDPPSHHGHVQMAVVEVDAV